ncbi:MAG: peptide deformylase [Ruminococcus sp.]|nr:peptide deformylase [Candidatus Copronaster equi]
MKKRYINALLALVIIISAISASAIPASAAIRRVIEGNHPILHEKCEKVDAYDERLYDLIGDLFDTINYNGAGCVGLAAPEVGVNKQVCVIADGSKTIVMVNPEIVEQSGQVTEYEGCECLPGQFLKITRPQHIVVRYNDENGNPVTLEEDGFLARVICHEIDHLNGILITDK